MNKVFNLSLAALCTTLSFSSASVLAADETIKVGVLHSLSGTMAISETTLKDTVLMLIEEQNKKGGLLGKKLEPVVVDPASNWPLFAEKARELIEKEKVDVVFGGWTSVSRKSMLPVFEELNSILFYPVQYEGEESSKNVFYTGAAPNQQAIPAVDYLMEELEVERWVLAGTDYVYPRTPLRGPSPFNPRNSNIQHPIPPRPNTHAIHRHRPPSSLPQHPRLRHIPLLRSLRTPPRRRPT